MAAPMQTLAIIGRKTACINAAIDIGDRRKQYHKHGKTRR
jgi:hypothetical protein